MRRHSKPPPPPPADGRPSRRKAGVPTLEPPAAPPPLSVQQVVEKEPSTPEEEIAFLERETESVDPRDRRKVAILHLEVARLLEATGAKPAVVEERARKASQICPELAATHQALQRQARRSKKWDEVLAAIDAELKVTKEPAARAALHLERGRLLRDVLKKPDAASMDLDRAMTLVPGDASSPEALRILHARQGEWDKVALIMERAAGASAPERALELRREAAVLRDHTLDQPGRAGTLYEMVLAESPADALAVAAAERFYGKAGRWLELCEVLVRQAESSSQPAVKFAAYMRAATIAAERLDDGARAGSWYEEASGIMPDDPAPLEAIADLKRRAGDWDGFDKTLERRASLPASPAARSAHAAMRASVLSQRLDRKAEAIPLLREAIRIDPTNPTLAHTLGELLGATGEEAERVDLEMLAAERIADSRERSDAMYRIGESCGHDPESAGRAVQAFTRSLEAAPANRAPFDALRRTYERTGDWEALAGLLDRRIDVIGDEDEKKLLLARLASIREMHLGDAEGATQALERMTALDPTDVVVLWDLQRLHAAAGRWKKHIEVLRAEADRVEDPAGRADLLWRCGVILEKKLGEDEAAWDAYEAAVEAHPAHRTALESLARIAGEVGSWPDHLELMDRAMQGLAAGEQAERLLRTARIADETLGDEAGAVERCRRALEKVEGHLPALEMLRRLHERRGEWKELATVTQRIAELETDAARRAALRARLGDLVAAHVQAPAEAARAYRSSLEDVAGYGPAIAGLERVGILGGDWESLAAMYRQAADEADDDARVTWLRKLAAVLAWRLDRPKEAIAALGELLAMDEFDHPALRETVLLELKLERWQEAADALARLAASSADPALEAAYLKEEVSIRTMHLREEATEKLMAALTTKPDDREALDMLESRELDVESLSRVLESRLETATDPVERTFLMLRLAAVAAATQEYEAERAMLERAVDELPGSLPVVRHARRAAQAAQDWARVVDLLESEGTSEVTTRPEARLAALHRAAEVSAEKLGDKARARASLARAFEISPDSSPIATVLASHLRDEGQWRDLAEVLGRHASSIDEAGKPAVLFDLACVLRDQLASPNEAARTLEQLLSIDPRHAGAHVAMGDICMKAGSWQKATESYRSAEESLERHSALWRHARLSRVRILSEKLGLFGDAETLVRDALQDRADDRELLFLLARVRRGAQDWAGVEAVLDQLIRSAAPSEASGLWVERGRMALALRDPERVASCLTRAAGLALQAPEAFETVRGFALDLPPDDAIHLLKDVLFHAPAEHHQATGPMRLLVAGLLARRNKQAAAESEVRLALELLPRDANAWILLAQTTKKVAEAHAALGKALGLDPFRPEIFEGMSRLGGDDKRFAVVRQRAAQVLTAFGTYEAAVKPDRPPTGEKRLQRNQLLAWVVHPSEPRRALELLAQAGTRLGVLHHQTDYGAIEPLPPENEVGRQVLVVAKLFGVERYDAFYTKQPQVSAGFWLDERPRVIVGPSIAAAPPAVLRFHLGRVFALLASGGTLASILTAEEVRRLVEALAGQQIVNIGEPTHVQRVGKVLGWMARRTLAQPARDYASAPEDLSGWQEAAFFTANRGGLLACADVSTARAALHALAGVPLPAPGASDTWEVSRSVPGLADLLAYAVSGEYTSARAQVT